MFFCPFPIPYRLRFCAVALAAAHNPQHPLLTALSPDTWILGWRLSHSPTCTQATPCGEPCTQGSLLPPPTARAQPGLAIGCILLSCMFQGTISFSPKNQQFCPHCRGSRLIPWWLNHHYRLDCLNEAYSKAFSLKLFIMQKSKALANQYKLRPSGVGFPSITMCPFITQLCSNTSAEALFVMPLSFGIFLGSSYTKSSFKAFPIWWDGFVSFHEVSKWLQRTWSCFSRCQLTCSTSAMTPLCSFIPDSSQLASLWEHGLPEGKARLVRLSVPKEGLAYRFYHGECTLDCRRAPHAPPRASGSPAPTPDLPIPTATYSHLPLCPLPGPITSYLEIRGHGNNWSQIYSGSKATQKLTERYRLLGQALTFVVSLGTLQNTPWIQLCLRRRRPDSQLRTWSCRE